MSIVFKRTLLSGFICLAPLLLSGPYWEKGYLYQELFQFREVVRKGTNGLVKPVMERVFPFSESQRLPWEKGGEIFWPFRQRFWEAWRFVLRLVQRQIKELPVKLSQAGIGEAVRGSKPGLVRIVITHQTGETW